MEQQTNNQTAPAMDPRSRVVRWVIKHDVSCASLVSLSFLIINSIVTIWRSRHEPSTVAFVVFCNVDIILLYWCQNQFENASPKRKEVLKAYVWILATMLTVAFCDRVAGIMPPVIAVIVWGMAVVSICGSFYALFVYDDARSTTEVKISPKQPC